MKTLTAMTLAALMLATQGAGAESLADPTRPPAALGERGAAGAPGDAAPRLQSVLIAPGAGGRQVAVIDGETVRLGQSYKGARVTRMTQTQVELVRGRERQVLRLEPVAALPDAAQSGAATVN